MAPRGGPDEVPERTFRVLGPKCPPGGPKSPSRGPQDAPRGPQEAPKRPPGGPQDVPKRPPRGFRTASERPPRDRPRHPKAPLRTMTWTALNARAPSTNAGVQSFDDKHPYEQKRRFPFLLGQVWCFYRRTLCRFAQGVVAVLLLQKDPL